MNKSLLSSSAQKHPSVELRLGSPLGGSMELITNVPGAASNTHNPRVGAGYRRRTSSCRHRWTCSCSAQPQGTSAAPGQTLQVLLAPKPSTAPLTAWTTLGLCFVSPESEQLKAEFGSAGMGNHLPAPETMPSVDGDAAAWSHTRHEAVS